MMQAMLTSTVTVTLTDAGAGEGAGAGAGADADPSRTLMEPLLAVGMGAAKTELTAARAAKIPKARMFGLVSVR
jgi:hypothetical protein